MTKLLKIWNVIKYWRNLKEFKKNIVVGRNGVYGMYSNPLYKETKKYKKSIENVDKE